MTDLALRYIVLDLADVKNNLGSHWNPGRHDEYMAACEICGEFLRQDISECPYCGVVVIWRNSRLWRNLYGSPATAERLFSIYPPDPNDSAGQELMRVSGATGFANMTEKARWDKCRRYLDNNYLHNIIAYCVRKTITPGSKSRPRSRRGIVVFSLNVAEKAVRNRKVPMQQPTTQQEINV